jgi:hypothetical protein
MVCELYAAATAAIRERAQREDDARARKDMLAALAGRNSRPAPRLDAGGWGGPAKRGRAGPDFTEQEREAIKAKGVCLDHMRSRAFGDVPCPRGRACRLNHKAEGDVAAIMARYPGTT